jgi:hypothetical protein
MKKPARPDPRPRQPLHAVDDRALVRVRGGNQSTLPPTTVSASDDWMAPVV